MLAPCPTHMGIDNIATVGKGNRVIEHLGKNEHTQFRTSKGGLKLGGKLSPLHRESPLKRKWHVMRDGDLWKQLQKSVKAKSPKAVAMKKVKGHATEKQVEDGEVEP